MERHRYPHLTREHKTGNTTTYSVTIGQELCYVKVSQGVGRRIRPDMQVTVTPTVIESSTRKLAEKGQVFTFSKINRKGAAKAAVREIISMAA